MLTIHRSEDGCQKTNGGGLNLRILTFLILFFSPCALSLAPLASDAFAAATVTVAWDKNAETDVIGYKFHYGTVSKNYQYTVDVENSTSCTISGLSEGTTYYFAAKAYNDKNIQSSYSEELAYTIPGTPPPQPIQYALTVDTVGDGSAELDPPGGTYDEGTVVQLTAVAEPGSAFDSWSGDITGSVNPVTITMDDDINITANFSESAHIYSETFNAYTAGSDPANWLDTAANNSMADNDSLFKVFDLQGDKVFGTTSTQTNIHSHFTDPAIETLSAYEYSGRMMMTTSDGGIGVTFFSQYPNIDAYYRLRRYDNSAFHIAPHGTNVTGDSDTGVVPLPNVWYWFRIQVEDTGSRTEIRAKVWPENSAEPAAWQVDCYDSNSSRLTAGTTGVWSYLSGSKYWDDLTVTPLGPLPLQYALTVGTIGDGSVQLDPPGGTYNEGTVVQLTAIATAGWEFSGWGGDQSGSTNPTTVTMAADMHVAATFTEIQVELPKYSLTVDTNGSGNAIFDPAGGVYEQGTRVMITASAEPGWEFSGWGGDLSGSTNPTTVTMAADMHVAATFTEIQVELPKYSLTVDTNGSGNAIFDPAGGVYEQGTRVMITASAEPGWEFSGWGGDLSGSTNPTTVTMAADMHVAATFTEIQVELPKYSLTVDKNGSGNAIFDPAGGVYEQGTRVMITASAEPGWEFSGWSGDLSGSTNPVTVDMTNDQNITATFSEITQHTLDVTSVGNGWVSINPDQAEYDLGQLVTMTATADPGWIFTGWSGDLSGTSNSTTLTVTGDHQVTAIFVDSTQAYTEDFEAYNDGDDPAGWLDTAANNSMAENDALFEVFDLGGERVFGTDSTQTDIHSHYVGAGSSILSGSEYTGRMMMTASDSGIGVTFFSQYPNTDDYYRLRRYGNGSFHIAPHPHGTRVVNGGTDTGVVPAPNVWYRFKIQVEDTGSQTEIRAKVWQDGTGEPTSWQANTIDTSSSRLLAGTFGLWSYYTGNKYWDDLTVTPLGPLPYLPADTDGDGIFDDDETGIYGTDPDNADTDTDGMNDADELAYWGDNWSDDSDNDGMVNLVDFDSDGDGFSDGAEILDGYDPLDPSIYPDSNSLTFEIGDIISDHNWIRVNFKEAFVDPVVVAKPISLNDSHPAVIRINNVDSSGFDIRIQEWDYLDGSHMQETVSYLVMEKGNYTLDDGTQIEAGRLETENTGSFGKFDFYQTFQETPVVVAGISSFNESDAVTGRLRNISNQGFEFCMQEQELNPKEHLAETVDYIAWQSSRGSLGGYTFEVNKTANEVKNRFVTIEFTQSFGSEPFFLADMQTTDGKDTANVRWQNIDNHSVEVQIDEEQSKNTETGHTTEVVGYMVFEY